MHEFLFPESGAKNAKRIGGKLQKDKWFHLHACKKGLVRQFKPDFMKNPLRIRSESLKIKCSQSGPLNRLNAILSLLQPLDRYRAPSAIESAVGRPLSRPISRPRTGRSPQPPHSKPLSGLNRAIVAL